MKVMNMIPHRCHWNVIDMIFREQLSPFTKHSVTYLKCAIICRLRKIKPQFLEVPELAVPCSFVDIVPPNCVRKCFAYLITCCNHFHKVLMIRLS